MLFYGFAEIYYLFLIIGIEFNVDTIGRITYPTIQFLLNGYPVYEWSEADTLDPAFNMNMIASHILKNDLYF